MNPYAYTGLDFAIVYLCNQTLITFENNKVVTINENLDGWSVSCSLLEIEFALGTKKVALHAERYSKRWSQHDGECLKIHRSGAPAIIRGDGTQEWWLWDKLHRDDGPAVIEYDGTKEWYHHGQLVNAEIDEEL